MKWSDCSYIDHLLVSELQRTKISGDHFLFSLIIYFFILIIEQTLFSKVMMDLI